MIYLHFTQGLLEFKKVVNEEHARREQNRKGKKDSKATQFVYANDNKLISLTILNIISKNVSFYQ